MKNTGDIRIDKIMPVLKAEWKKEKFEKVLLRTPTVKRLNLTDLLPIGELAVVDQGENLVAGYIDNMDCRYAGEIPVIIFGDHTRRIKYIDFPFGISADGCKIFKPKDFLDIKFFYHYLCSLDISSQGYSRHYKFLKEIDVPIPNIDEQQKIAKRLEFLLNIINSANERLNKIPSIIKRFRQSVLSAACSERLTEDWREGKDLPEWEEKRIGDIFDTQLGKMLSKKAYDPALTMLPYLRNANVQWGRIETDDILQMGFNEREISKFTLESGDLLMCEGGDIGRCALWDSQIKNCLYQKALHRIRPKDRTKVTTKWLYYYFVFTSLNGRLYEGISETTIKHLPQDRLVEIVIPLPPLAEQEEIVRRVDKLFALADKIEERCNKVKRQLERAEKAIYAKAFRGEL